MSDAQLAATRADPGAVLAAHDEKIRREAESHIPEECEDARCPVCRCVAGYEARNYKADDPDGAALREVKAQAWDEGAIAIQSYDPADPCRGPAPLNPYRDPDARFVAYGPSEGDDR